MRRHATAAMPAVVVAAAMAACGAEPLAPLPVQTAAPSPATASTPAAQPSDAPVIPTAPPTRVTRPTTLPPLPARTTTAAPPPPPSGSSACFGAVEHDLDLQKTVLDLVTSMCFRAGGVLRLRNIGPGLVTVAPDGLTARSYEAGVVSLRFLRPGTVTVTVPQDDATHIITVVVIA